MHRKVKGGAVQWPRARSTRACRSLAPWLSASPFLMSPLVATRLHRTWRRVLGQPRREKQKPQSGPVLRSPMEPFFSLNPRSRRSDPDPVSDPRNFHHLTTDHGFFMQRRLVVMTTPLIPAVRSARVMIDDGILSSSAVPPGV